MKGLNLTLLFASLVSGICLGQQSISLSDYDIALLELEFAGIELADQQSGFELPAQVINSPDAMAEISSRFAGVLEQWNERAGSFVAEDEILAVIRSPEVLSLQQQYLEELNSLELEQQRLLREKGLLDQGIISEQRFQQSQGELRAAQLAVDGLELQLQLAGLTGGDLQDLKDGELDPGLLLLRTPREGLLTHLAYRVGQYVDSNSVVATLTDGGNPWVSVQVPARLLNFLEIGTSLRLPGSEHSLTLRRRDFEIEPASQSVEILAQFNNPASYVPGQLLTVSIQPGQDALFVPSSAVVRDGAETFVYVKTPEGVEARSVTLLPVGEGYLAGSNLNIGDEILVKGAALVKGIQMGLGTEQ